MKIHSTITLEASIEVIFESYINSVRNPHQDLAKHTVNIINEIGDLGPGTQFEVHQGGKVSLNTMIKNHRPQIFSYSIDAPNFSAIIENNFKQDRKNTVIETTETIFYKPHMWRGNLFLPFKMTGLLRSRHFMDTAEFVPLSTNQKIKTKYRATILGVPYQLIQIPLWLLILLAISTFYSFVHS